MIELIIFYLTTAIVFIALTVRNWSKWRTAWYVGLLYFLGGLFVAVCAGITMAVGWFAIAAAVVLFIFTGISIKVIEGALK